MKPKSVFKALPAEDQQRILDLCAGHTYDEVLEIIQRPPPEGLQLKTSYSALCRFNCSHNADARKAAILDQAAAALQFIRQRSAGSLRTAILSLLETRVFEALRANTPIKELKDELAALKEIQKGFLAEEKWRHQPGIEADKEYSAHLARSRRDNSPDFVPCDEHGATDPAAAPLASEPGRAGEITPELIASIDQRIAEFGPHLVRKNAATYGYPRVLVDERIGVYYHNLPARGASPLTAALQSISREIAEKTTSKIRSNLP